jgi:hypothetical protein
MRFLGLVFATLAPSVAYANVVSIAPQKIIDAVGVPKGDGFAGYLSAMYGAGVAGVAVIAVVMIVWGAIQVFGESVWGKTQGKAKIWNAVWGLLLAAGSFVILRTVSESLVQADFALSESLGAETQGVAIQFNDLGSVSSTDLTGIDRNGNTGNRPDGYTGTPGVGQWAGFTPPPGATAAERLAAAARYAADNHIGSCDGPGGGTVACVYMGRQILDNARVSFGSGTNYTPTALGVFERSPNFSAVPGGLANSRPGDIVISPTADTGHENGGPAGSGTGHIGFVVGNGGSSIVSNGSTPRSVEYNYDAGSWGRRFSDNGIYVFRPN